VSEAKTGVIGLLEELGVSVKPGKNIGIYGLVLFFTLFFLAMLLAAIGIA